MGVRKSFRTLTATERDSFLRAVLTLKNTIANPGAPASQQISVYDQFSAITSPFLPSGVRDREIFQSILATKALASDRGTENSCAVSSWRSRVSIQL